MIRDEVLSIVAAVAKSAEAAIFIGNGYNARALCVLEDQAKNFYMLGSMGLGPSLAAGFSHCMHMPVIVIEGDGNALMGLSGFPVAARAAKGTFIHIVLDNRLYESTGGQQTLSPGVDFVQMALAAGYNVGYYPENPQVLASTVETALQKEQRTFICVPTEVSTHITHPRVPYQPHYIAERFREAVGEAV